jgi:putative transposase
LYHGRKLYLVTILDIYTRKILGFSFGWHHNADLVFEALEMAVAIARCAPDIFHSDRGTEFMAQMCTCYLEEKGTRISVSKKASPWENGYQESFFGKFKEEFGDINRFETLGELLEEVCQKIHYYNHRRIHTALKMSPHAFAGLHPVSSLRLPEYCLHYKSSLGQPAS